MPAAEESIDSFSARVVASLLAILRRQIANHGGLVHRACARCPVARRCWWLVNPVVRRMSHARRLLVAPEGTSTNESSSLMRGGGWPAGPIMVKKILPMAGSV